MTRVDNWRKKIDRVDKQLVSLLNERARLAEEIGKLKETLGQEVYSPEREEEILRNVIKWNDGPMPVDVLRRLYERILDESRALEQLAMAGRKQNSPPQKRSNPKKRRRG